MTNQTAHSRLADALRRPDGKLPGWLRGLIALVSTAMIVQAWSNWERLGNGWRTALVTGTVVAVAGNAGLVANSYRFAGAALSISALLAPTGFGVLLNVALVVLALPLVVARPAAR